MTPSKTEMEINLLWRKVVFLQSQVDILYEILKIMTGKDKETLSEVVKK